MDLLVIPGEKTLLHRTRSDMLPEAMSAVHGIPRHSLVDNENGQFVLSSIGAK